MQNKYKIILFLLIGFLMFNYENAYAKRVSVQKCVSGILYDITWDDSKNSEVKYELIDEEAIKNGNVSHHFATYSSGNSTTKYEFKSVSTAQRCEVETNGNIVVCPKDSGFGDIDIRKFLDTKETDENVVTGIDENGKQITEKKLGYKYIDMQINESSGMLYVKIKDVFNGKVKLRNVSNKSNKNDYGNKKADSYPNEEFLSSSDGYFHVGYVSPGTTLILEAYLSSTTKTGKCQNSYLGNIGFPTLSAGEIKIPNPALTNPNLYNCNLVISNEYMPLEFKKTAFPECYADKKPTIYYSEKANLANTIKNRYEKLSELFKSTLLLGSDYPKNTTLEAGDFSCTDGEQKYTVQSYNSAGKYWAISCYEEYTIVPSSPKLVYAGDGFEYGVDVDVKRYCNLVQTGTVQMKPRCTKTCGHSCYLPDGSNPWGDPSSAGPNEEFDQCVQSCDGGKYTQNCINTCYSKVYNDGISVDDLFSGNIIDDYKNGIRVNKMSVPGGATIVRERTDNNDCPDVNSCSDGCGNTYRFSDWCEGQGTICTEWETIGPAGCSFTPTTDYNNDLSVSISELSGYLAYMESYNNINDGEYTLSIMDSYLKLENGKTYTYKYTTLSDPKLQKNVKTTSSSSGSVTTIIGSEGDTASYIPSSMRGKTITIKMPNAYLSKINGMAYYKTAIDTNLNLYTANLKDGKLTPSTLNQEFYYYGLDKYYTNILSDNFNVKVTDTTVYLKNNTQSIQLDINGVGTEKNLNKVIDCFYGVYNQTVDKSGDPENPDIENDSNGGGITFIFRPIDLNDNFPNDRNPRWNWTNGSSVLDTTSAKYKLLNYKIDPVATNKEIERKGYTIYDDKSELDYDITLTPENIRAIREYNKEILDINKDGYENYLDYDMNCGTMNNREYCYSNFLDNQKYVSYKNGNYTTTTRKDIAICNNAYGQSCVEY